MVQKIVSILSAEEIRRTLNRLSSEIVGDPKQAITDEAIASALRLTRWSFLIGLTIGIVSLSLYTANIHTIFR